MRVVVVRFWAVRVWVVRVPSGDDLAAVRAAVACVSYRSASYSPRSRSAGEMTESICVSVSDAEGRPCCDARVISA